MKKGGLGWVARMAEGVVAQWTGLGLRWGRWEEEVMLWMVFVCVAAGVFEEREVEGWVLEWAREGMSGLGLAGGWEGVGAVLDRFPWVEALHGRKGRALLERCTSRLGNGIMGSI